MFMLHQNWQLGGSALGWLPIQFISPLLKRRSQPLPTKRTASFQMGDPHKPCTHIQLSCVRTHTHTLYLQGSKHHHFLLCALNFLQQDGPLGLFIELVHSDGIILWGDRTQVLTGVQTNSEETQTLQLTETRGNITAFGATYVNLSIPQWANLK